MNGRPNTDELWTSMKGEATELLRTKWQSRHVFGWERTGYKLKDFSRKQAAIDASRSFVSTSTSHTFTSKKNVATLAMN